jgi:glutathione S-transferase
MQLVSTKITGSYSSPYVRKVLVCLDIKGIPFEIDPIVPFYGNDEFARLSPLRRIPVLLDDSVTLADSSVICEYLDERYPEPSMFPEGPRLRARARWLEESADTCIGPPYRINVRCSKRPARRSAARRSVHQSHAAGYWAYEDCRALPNSQLDRPVNGGAARDVAGR